MRVLVTGATGSFGTPICRRLAHRGHEVIAMARHQPDRLPDRVQFVRGDIQDAASVAAAVVDVDVVLHLAWFVASTRESELARRINVEGTENILQAIRDHGATARLVFASSVMGYGSKPAHGPYREDESLQADEGFLYGYHKKLVEARIKESGVPHLIARTAPVIGRGVRNVVTDQFAGPAVLGIAGDESLWQFVHSDDVTRFLVHAVGTDATGIVNLAAEGGMTLERVGEILGKPIVRVPHAVASRMVRLAWHLRVSDIDPAALDALRHLPIADTSKLRDEFDFQCAWTNELAVADARRSLITYFHLGAYDSRRLGLPFTAPGWRPDAPSLPDLDPDYSGSACLGGRFDDHLVHELGGHTAIRGNRVQRTEPLPPLPLSLATVAMRAAMNAFAELRGLDDAMSRELQRRTVVSVGHRLFASNGLVRVMCQRIPGREWDEKGLGSCKNASWPSRLRNLAWRNVGNVRTSAGTDVLAGVKIGRSRRWFNHHANAIIAVETDPAAMTEAELDAQASLMLDTFVDATVLHVNAALLDAAPVPVRSRLLQHLDEALAGALAVTEPTALGLSSATDDLDELREVFWAVTERLRNLVAEKAGRLVGDDVIGDASDIAFLTIDELLVLPPNPREEIAQRRLDHERLKSVDPEVRRHHIAGGPV